MFLKNNGSPTATILTSIFFKKTFLPIIFSNLLNEALSIAKHNVIEDIEDFDNDFIEEIVKKRVLLIANDINTDTIDSDDIDDLFDKSTFYMLPTLEDYDCSNPAMLMTYQTTRTQYDHTESNKYFELLGEHYGFILAEGHKINFKEEFEKIIHKKVRNRLFQYDIILNTDSSNDNVYDIINLLSIESKAMVPFIKEALPFGLPEYEMEEIPHKDRIVTALEISYVLLKYVPVIHEDFTDELLPVLLESLLLTEDDAAAAMLTTRLTQLRDVFQVQTLLTNDIQKFLDDD